MNYLKEDKEIELSEREKRWDDILLRVYTLTDIGEKLFLSVKTVDTYKNALWKKLIRRKEVN